MEKINKKSIDETEKHIFQQYIDSEQYSIHVLSDTNGKPISVVGMVNLKKHMDGETFNIKTIKDDKLIRIGKKLGEKLGHIGPLSADVHKIRENYVILELNPRISGCYSISHYASNFTEKLVSIIEGKKVKSKIDDYRKDVIMMKEFAVYQTTEDKIDRKIIKYL